MAMEQIIQSPPGFEPFDIATAIWETRHLTAQKKHLFKKLSAAVEHAGDLSSSQWAQLFAAAVWFKPDKILELGRGFGNSTCVFTEAMHTLGGKERSVTSLCLSNVWEKEAFPKIRPLVPPQWDSVLNIVKEDILFYPYERLLFSPGRYLIFWDAHGFDIAECVLGKILPLIAGKEHLVIMHDLTDTRSCAESQLYYRDKGLWKRNNEDGRRLILGNINSAVEQSVSILDFSTRNRIRLVSADEMMRKFTSESPEKSKELQAILGPDFFSLTNHWFYFSLNERSGTFTFPRFDPPSFKEEARMMATRNSGQAGFFQTIKLFLKRFLRKIRRG